jgi:hypothetical protein
MSKQFDRVWATPRARTFTIKSIAELLKAEILDGLWCDPFVGKNSPAQVTNYINPERPAIHHIDAIDFPKSLRDHQCDGVLLYPPYSIRQVSEHYKAAIEVVTGWNIYAPIGRQRSKTRSPAY